MRVKYWNDGYGYHYKEIIYNRYQVLVSLATEYMKRKGRVSLVPYDMCRGEWILTVREAA